MPFAGQILGKRSSSLYDGTVPTWSYSATRQKIQSEADPQALKQYKQRINAAREAIQLNTDQIQNDFTVEQQEMIVRARENFRQDAGPNLISKVAPAH